MDSFNEQMIKKQPTQNDKLMTFLIIFASMALAAACVFLGMMFPQYFMIGIFLGVGCIYGGIRLWQNLSLEYEYIFTNGDLDIDKIIAQRSRKRLISVKVNELEDIGLADDCPDSDRTIVMASAFDPELADYYMDYKHRSLGDVRIIFTPDEDTLGVIKTHLPRALRNNIKASPRTEDQ